LHETIEHICTLFLCENESRIKNRIEAEVDKKYSSNDKYQPFEWVKDKIDIAMDIIIPEFDSSYTNK